MSLNILWVTLCCQMLCPLLDCAQGIIALPPTPCEGPRTGDVTRFQCPTTLGKFSRILQGVHKTHQVHETFPALALEQTTFPNVVPFLPWIFILLSLKLYLDVSMPPLWQSHVH